MNNPMGAFNPACMEMAERMSRKMVPPKPGWNLMGPYISRRWREALARINKRLVLQYFPYGKIAGSKERGFWSVCLKMPRTNLLFKQAVISLVDDNGKFSPPSWGMLAAIKRGMWRFRHEGFDAELDTLDRQLDAAGQKRQDKEQINLFDSIMKTMERLDPSTRKLGLSRISVPQGYCPTVFRQGAPDGSSATIPITSTGASKAIC